MSSTMQDEIDRIFKRMSLIQAQLLLVDLGDEQYHDGYASWYRTDAALMESCRTGMCRPHKTIIIKLAHNR